jgi:ribosome-associated protein
MLQVTTRIAIAEREIREEFIHTSGPGGQNVNKVATGVQLRFDVRRSPSLPDDVRERLLRQAHRRIDKNGILMIDARRYRTQERNRRDARERLVALIRKAARPPRVRRPTQPTAESVRRRLTEKRQRGETKRRRRPIGDDED